MVADLVAGEAERGDHAEVSTAAAQCPEQIGMGRGARGDEGSVGKHHVRRQQVVDCQTEPPGQVADPAAEGESPDSGRRDEARWRGHPECHRRVVDVAPRAAAVHAHRVAGGIHRRAAHGGQVDDERVVPDPEPAGVVPAAAHREIDSVLAGEPDAGDDVGDVDAAGDRRGSTVDHGVVDGSCRVVGRVAGPDRRPTQGRGQLGVVGSGLLPGSGG